MADDKQTVTVPDIGDAAQVDVIEILIKPGDHVKEDDSLVTLEGDKASMEIPSPVSGVVESIIMKVGDKASEGDAICVISTATADHASDAPTTEGAVKATVDEPAPIETTVNTEVAEVPEAVEKSTSVYAGPAVRRIANELDIDLNQIQGSGPKGRITKADLKQSLSHSSAAAGNGINVMAAGPQVDFSKFGDVESLALTKIQKFSGANLHRNWVTIPHVTQFDEADITEMEAFRQANKKQAANQGIKLTPIVFIMKAVVSALKRFPKFNSSLAANGEELIMKHYFNVGVAVDTPNGLVVPVIRDVDKKGLLDLAKELGEISLKAREKGLSISDMQGGCFTISSLGGIGGTAFTPIINAPEVAILGLSRTKTKPVYNAQGQLQPRLMLPLSLSYDHRVIDGADGARFIVYLSQCLADMRTLLL